ncbi:MAG: bifunctional DNA primase/polymerase, partial [Desulfitobacteriaceae bacterium]|nr:bifunctional DNA primase/polymerase [Desulfitobacteriaceae bacterium]
MRVAKKGKRPLDAGWPEKPMYAWDPRLQAWLRENGNYGVTCGGGLVILDLDTVEMKALPFPRTFTVGTPMGGWHLYFKCSLPRSFRVWSGSRYVVEVMS